MFLDNETVAVTGGRTKATGSEDELFEWSSLSLKYLSDKSALNCATVCSSNIARSEMKCTTMSSKESLIERVISHFGFWKLMHEISHLAIIRTEIRSLKTLLQKGA